MTVEDITVNGISYKWYNYTEPLEILNSSDINNAQSNIQTIKSILSSKGYEVEELVSSTATPNTQLFDIIDKLNAVEYNLDVINDTITKSVYYGEIYRAVEGNKAHNTEQIWRWFQGLLC